MLMRWLVVRPFHCTTASTSVIPCFITEVNKKPGSIILFLFFLFHMYLR